MITPPKVHISCFDLDHTLITTTSSFRFGVYLYKNRSFNFATMLYLTGWYWLHKIRAIPMETMQEKIFSKLFLGHSAEKMTGMAESFVEQNFDTMLYHPAVHCLQEAQRQGHFTLILSSSPTFLVKLFAERFHVDAWDGTRYELDNEQRFSMISHLMQGKDKAAYLMQLTKRLGISAQQTTAYTDSILDKDLLLAAGTAVGVNPDKKLRMLCKLRHWQILP